MSTFLHPIAKAFAELLVPLEEIVTHKEEIELFVLQFGWVGHIKEGNVAAIKAALGFEPLLEELFTNLAALENGINKENLKPIGETIKSGKKIYDKISKLEASGTTGQPYPFNQSAFWEQLAQELPEHLTVLYFEKNQPVLYALLHITGIIQYEKVEPAEAERVPYTRYRIHFDALGKLFGSPGDHLTDLYQWGKGGPLDHQKLLRTLERIFHAFHVPVALGPPGKSVAEAYYRDDQINEHHINELEIPIIEGVDTVEGHYWKLGAVLFPVASPPQQSDKLTGLGIQPLLDGAWETKQYFTEDIYLEFMAAGEAKELVARVYPDKAELNAGAPDMAFAVALKGEPAQPWILLGERDDHRLELGGFLARLGITDSPNDPDVYFEIGTGEGKDGEIPKFNFVLQFNEVDDFIKSVVQQEALSVDFAGRFRFSAKTGFSFEGQAGFEIAFPIHLSLGPIEIMHLYLALRAGLHNNRTSLDLDLGVGISGNLGPIALVIEDIGMRVSMLEAGRGEAGSFGGMDLQLGFKPPKGVGLSMDMAVIRGGGYLYLDYDKEEYAGALELMITGLFAIKAVGIITTRLPDGSKGFSMLIILSVEFGTGIQLGFGFTLLGVGGLVGINRTINAEQIVQGIRSGAIESVMFPENIIANAPTIINNLRNFFPAKKDSFLVGPMAKIAWGTPPIITLSLGVIIDYPVTKIMLLGMLKSILPDEKAKLIVIQFYFTGVLDIPKQQLYFFGELFESRIMTMNIQGGMGLLLDFSDNPNFVLTLGGFHPRFPVPELPFQVPVRFAIDVINTPLTKLRLSAYFALTTNTLQFGASAELTYGLDELGLKGHLSFNALIQFSPFYFIVDVSGSVVLKVIGIGEFSVHLSATLEGPGPWRIRGSASVDLVFTEAEVDFEEVWGEGSDTTLEPIEVLPLLIEEIRTKENWEITTVRSHQLLVSLRSFDAEEQEALLLHPLGAITFRQKKIPLGLEIQRVGQQRVVDGHTWHVRPKSAGLQQKGKVTEPFAMAQFVDMDAAARLSQPAFEKVAAGSTISTNGSYDSGTAVCRVVRCELAVIDSNYESFEKKRYHAIPGYIQVNALNANAAAKSKQSLEYEKLRHPFEEKMQLHDEAFAVAFSSNNKALNAEAVGFASQVEATAFLRREIARNTALRGQLHTIPQHELN